MAETVETASEDESSFQVLSKTRMLKIKVRKKHVISPNKSMNFSRATLQIKDDDHDDISVSLWMSIGSEQFLLCTLSGERIDYSFSAKICETVPVILYLKGHESGSFWTRETEIASLTERMTKPTFKMDLKHAADLSTGFNYDCYHL